MLRLPSFTYRQPKTLKDALVMKADAGPHGVYVAGGTDLYPNMKRRHQEPSTVISLAGIRALRRIGGSARRSADRRTGGSADGGLVAGSGVTLTELISHRRIRSAYPALRRAADLIS